MVHLPGHEQIGFVQVVSGPLRIRVGIVAYRTPMEQLLALGASLACSAQRAAEEVPIDLAVTVVVNDPEPQALDSVRDAARRIEALLPPSSRLRLIHGHGNIGYGAAQNRALETGDSDYDLILNPDVELDTMFLLVALRHLESHAGDVIVTPQGYDAEGNYARLAKRQPSLLVLALRALAISPSSRGPGRLIREYVYSDLLPSRAVVEIENASGCCMMCRSDALAAIGGFDEGYFLYFEDYDLSRRIRALGRIVELPGARIIHHGGHTSRRGVRRIMAFARSALRFFRHYGWRLW